VDVYLPGCPPRPEAIIDAIIKLRKKIANDSIQERDVIKQTHRYYSTTHSMKSVPQILTGEYLLSDTRVAPPKELSEAIGMPIPPALLTQKEEVNRG
jgi:NAD(P)H-quinone oxidoreductase subunit K